MILEASVSVHIPAHRFSTMYRDFGIELHRLHGLRLNRFEVIKVAKRSRRAAPCSSTGTRAHVD